MLIDIDDIESVLVNNGSSFRPPTPAEQQQILQVLQQQHWKHGGMERANKKEMVTFFHADIFTQRHIAILPAKTFSIE